MDNRDGPPLVRPVPRRPFELHHSNPTPPDQDSTPPTPAPPADFGPPRFMNLTPDSSLSRPQSLMNLTSSTLYGIYSPTASSRDRVFGDRDDTDTPWGTGAQTPIKRPSVDEDTFELMRDRSHLVRRRSSLRSVERTGPPSLSAALASLTMRTLLLFVLGLGYGVLVTTRFRLSEQKLELAENIIRPTYNWSHLAFWGVAGVVLGSLLPWIDGVWEDSFGCDDDDESVIEKDDVSAHESDAEPGMDWALVVRAIGAFVGIVFAIRRVAWASTLQVSLTLALANPLLWWLIDRSKPGLLLSAAVGLAGSVFLLGVNPDMMPAPANASLRSNATSAGGLHGDPLMLGGLASQRTVETGVWMLSILFCSCVCFGNIGRRLALSPTTAAKGRWAGLR